MIIFTFTPLQESFNPGKYDSGRPFFNTKLSIYFYGNIPCPKRYHSNFAEYNPMYCGFMVQRDGAAVPFGGKGTDAVVG